MLARLSVIVADLGDRSEGEAAALVLLSRVVDKAGIWNAWTAFREDGMRLAETAGRRDVPALWNLLEAHGIWAVNVVGPPLLQREDHVPPYPHPFVGRDAVVGEVRDLLSVAGDGRRPVVAVRGLPGSGKTAVAAVVADELRPAFPGGVLWASIGPNPNPLSVLAGWGRALGAEDLAGYPDVGAASARMKALLRDRRALLVLDDVWEAEHAGPFAGGGPKSATLATTRSRRAAQGMAPGGTVLELGPLSEAEAVFLLEEFAPSLDEDDRGRLGELAAKLEYLPLALVVAGRLLEEEATLGLGVGDLLARLEQGERLLEAAVPPDLLDLLEATPTVAALLGRSTDALGDAERERFARLGAFEPGPASFDLPAAGAVWGDAEEEGTRVTLTALVGRGLVDPDGSGRFSLHPVLSMQARSLLRRAPDGGRGARLLHATHYLELLRSAEELYKRGREASRVGLALFDAEWENIRAGQFWAASHLADGWEDAEAARLASGYADAGWPLLAMRASFDEQARWLEDALEGDRFLIEASAFAKVASESPEETQRTHHSARARHLHALASVRRQARRTDEAFALEHEAREIYRSLGDRRGESTTLNGLGALHMARREYALAEQRFLSALGLLDAEAADSGVPTKPPRHRDVDRAAVLGNLGPLYRHMGRAEPASEAIGEAIAIFRALGDMFQVGIALNNRGSLRSVLQGDRTGARKDFLAARRIFRDLGSRRDEAVSLLGLGREHQNAGEHRRAQQKAREVIDVCQELGDLSWRRGRSSSWVTPASGSDTRRRPQGSTARRLTLPARRRTRGWNQWPSRVSRRPPSPSGTAKEALSCFEEAVAVARSVPLPRMLGFLLFDAVKAHDAFGERGVAVEKAEEALRNLKSCRLRRRRRCRRDFRSGAGMRKVARRDGLQDTTFGAGPRRRLTGEGLDGRALPVEQGPA